MKHFDAVIVAVFILFGMFIIIDTAYFFGYINGKLDKEKYLDALAKRTLKTGVILAYPSPKKTNAKESNEESETK